MDILYCVKYNIDPALVCMHILHVTSNEVAIFEVAVEEVVFSVKTDKTNAASEDIIFDAD